MNILFIVPSLSGGGAERVVARLASALAGEHRVYILVTWRLASPGGNYPLDPRITVREMKAREPAVAGLWPRRIARRLQRSAKLRALTWIRDMRALKKEWAIDLSISFLTSCNYDNVRSRAKERTIISIRSMLLPTIPSERKEGAREMRRIRYAAKKAGTIVAVSKNAAKEQERLFGADPGKLRVIYNPVDPEELLARAEAYKRAVTVPEEAAAKPEESLCGDMAEGALSLERMIFGQFLAFRKKYRVLLLTAGRLCHQKGQWHLLRAFAKVTRTHPEAGLVILGEGELQPYLEETARANGIADAVFFAGFRKEPFAYLKEADIFVMSSLFEGFSNAQLEAAALGIPQIAGDCDSGPRELLAPDTDPSVRLAAKEGDPALSVEEAAFGVLVPVCSEREIFTAEPLEAEEGALALAMERLIEDGEKREAYAEKGRRRAADFTPEAVLSEWRKLF